jgi:hypothetical protein
MTPVEIIARGIVRATGRDPDSPDGFQRLVGGDNGRPPLWHASVAQADAIWQELQQAGYGKA